MVNVGCLNAVTTIQYKGMKAIKAKMDKMIREIVLLENRLNFMLFINCQPLLILNIGAKPLKLDQRQGH